MDNPIRLHWLDPRDPRQPFPPAHLAMREPNGLLAIGGDLSTPRLLNAYAQGIFPWYNADEPILWWCPDPRAVLPPAQLHVSRSLARRIRRRDVEVRFDSAFDAVLAGCAAPRHGTRGTWLGADMQRAYRQLFAEGHAHCIEIWRDDRLIGGLYGVAIGQMFYGESMFSAETDASKLALYWLCRHLRAWGYVLLDCQVYSPHLGSLGAVELPRDVFLEQARPAARRPGRRGPWQFDPSVAA